MRRLDAHGQPLAAFNFADNVKKAINTLLGLCSGMIADGHLNDREILFLDTWLRDNAFILKEWPANVIGGRVRAVLADGRITEEERADLHSTLCQLLGGSPEETGAAGGMATRLPVDTVDALTFRDRVFCLTGKFVFGIRSRCRAAILERGGVVADDITKDLDYLVIGTLASRDWAHTSHGRKIEKALEYKQSGSPIAIIAEEHWVTYL
jgi:NAD-dependent DNA ligase